MDEFPSTVRHPANRIAARSQYTQDIDGYVFDGADGSQVAFWTCREERQSEAHAHPFDEYIVVVAGVYTVSLEGRHVTLRRGDELFIPRGVLHGGHSVAGTRTIHHFAGRRAERRGEPG